MRLILITDNKKHLKFKSYDELVEYTTNARTIQKALKAKGIVNVSLNETFEGFYKKI
jgi:hypothetical protein